MSDQPSERAWFATLSPTEAQLDAAEQAIVAKLSVMTSAAARPAGEQLSLSSEWVALLRERPVANTLLAGAAAAAILMSLPLGAAALAAKLFIL